MSNTYSTIEGAIKTAITGTGTPFKKVYCYGGQLSDAQLRDEIGKLVSMSPAALVLFGTSDTNGGLGGQLSESAMFWVICVAAGRSGEAALAGDTRSSGVYDLLDWVRSKLHQQAISGIPNQLIMRKTWRFPMGDSTATVAAYVREFEAPLVYSE